MYLLRLIYDLSLCQSVEIDKPLDEILFYDACQKLVIGL